MLRLVLPPNLAAAVVRDAIPVKVEFDAATVPTPGLFPVLAHLQRLCGTPQPPAFLQLSRAQLRDLAAAAGQEPIFVHNGQAGVWRHANLLGTPPPPAAPAPAAKSARPLAPRPAAVGRPAAPAALLVDGSENFLALTLPSPEHPQYARALELVKTSGFTLDPSSRKWWLRDRHKTLNFLAAHGDRLRTGFDADFTANFEQHTARLRSAEIIADAQETAGGYALTLGLKAGSADDATLREAIATNRRYLEAGGQVYLIAPAQLEKLATAQRALAGDPTAPVAPRRAQRVSSARVAEAEAIIEELAPGWMPPETWKTRSAALRNLTSLQPAPIAATLDAQLRPYQRLGVAWLWHLHRAELGGILADEMGLGKTLQALALLTALEIGRVIPNAPIPPSPPTTSDPTGRRRSSALNSQPSTLNSSRPRATSLVVAPASLLENWRRETLRFAPALRVFVHHGDHRLAAAADFAAHDLVITSYGTLTRDQELFTSVDLGVVIADEAQHIKNRRSQNAAALRALRARSRFLLTGTPLENSLDDLRSLFEFLLPGYLQKVPAGLRGDERAWFDQRLRAQTAPYILRRTKLAVAPELPEKIEQIIWCDLTPAQAKLYRDTQESSERQLLDLAAAGASEGRLQFAALTQLLRLRQICCDPRLINKTAADSEVGRVIPNAPIAPEPNVPSGPQRRVKDNSPYRDSAKLEAFTELLAEAIDDGHRLLVFSQFTSLLALLREELAAQDIAHCYLDGSMSPRARQAEVDRFQADTSVPLFLLSLKAGGTGLNLTGADTVIHFDPWWNPAAEAQATDRAHRIGQTRTVTSYKLICAGTVEEKVLALQTEKRALLADVFEASDAAAAKLSLADLRDLLRA
jgi:superfamily II DNA or RNA helicase